MFTVASMLCGLAPTAGLLIAARVLQAVGAAALVPASLALVLQTFPREKVPVAVAIWGAIGAVAGAAGPTLGALVVENLGWRWAFFINLPVGIVSFVLGRRVLPEGREANPGRLPDPLGVVLLAAGLALAAFAIVQTDDVGLGQRARFVGTVAVSAVLIAVFVWRCRRVSNPLLDLRCSSRNRSAGPTPAMFVYASRVQRDVPRQRAVPHRGVALLDPAGRPGDLGRAAHRRRHRAVVRHAWPDASASAGCSSPAAWSGRPAASLLLARATTDSRTTSASTSRRSCSPRSASRCACRSCRRRRCRACPADRFGSGSAVNQAVRNLGATLGVALVVAFTADVTPATALDAFHQVWWLLVGCGLAVSLLSTRLPRRITAAKPAALVELAAA